MKNTGFLAAVAGALACASIGVQASMSSASTLAFDAGTGPDSYFEMNSLKTPLNSFNGIVLGTTQPASGSHSGNINGSESPNIDDAWYFFFNTGMSQTTSNVTIKSDDGNGNVELDFSGWNVTWNGIPSIPMGSGAYAGNPEGTAIVTCGNTCENGDTYVLDYSATVPVGDASGFGGVPYALHLQGTITAAPVTGQLPANAVLSFDEASSNFGLVTDAGPPPVFTYVPEGSLNGIVLGTTQPASGSHTGDPDGSESPNIDKTWAFFSNTGMSQTTETPVTVVNQDDPKNVLLDFAGWGVTWNGIANIPLGSGAWNGNPEGQAVMHCANTCAEGDTYTLDYSATIPDGDPSGFGNIPYSLHLEGTIGVPVTGQLPANAVLSFDEASSNFGLVTDAGPPPVFTYVPEGSLNGIVLGTTQPASGSHTGDPDGSESPNIDKTWAFFSNTGMSQTTETPVTVVNQDDSKNVLLDFAGWGVTWNGIANIPLGSGAWNGNPEGQAVIHCANTCAAGDTYTLDYSATIPDGDPSGFGNVPYSLHLEGTIGVAGGGGGGGGHSSGNGCTMSSNNSPNQGEWWLLAGFIGWLGWNQRKRKLH